MIDPRNPATSESNTNTWSLVVVPGSEFMDTKDVPHGAVAEVTYFSKSLKRFRRMHVYTPPGYESGQGKYPIFYLLHGASDCDDSWTSVSRAGFILDNLIAAGKAKPMVVVMPAGHTGPFMSRPRGESGQPQVDEFSQDFQNDIMPYAESHYRVYTDPQNRALAGLSMGGGQSLTFGLRNLDTFAWVGGFSSAPNTQPAKTLISDPAVAKEKLRLLWVSCGDKDGLMSISKPFHEALTQMGVPHIWHVDSGAHTWPVWKNDLYLFSQMLFRGK